MGPPTASSSHHRTHHIQLLQTVFYISFGASGCHVRLRWIKAVTSHKNQNEQHRKYLYIHTFPFSAEEYSSMRSTGVILAYCRYIRYLRWNSFFFFACIFAGNILPLGYRFLSTHMGIPYQYRYFVWLL